MHVAKQHNRAARAVGLVPTCALLCLLLCMLFAQALGLMHRQLHSPDVRVSMLGAQVSQQTPPTTSTSQTADDASGLRHDASVCSLLDHLLLGSPLLSGSLQVPLAHAAPVRPSQCVAPSPKSDPQLAFLARGPPQFIL